MTQDTPAATLSYELVENDGAPTLHEEIEAIVACLGDDAAALRADNPEDERAANMDAAAALIERLATQADTAAAGGAEIAASVEAELRAKMAAALAVQSPAAMAYRDSTPGLHVGESAFESWYDQYLLTAPVHQSGKQRARDAYAAGMGDPLVAAQIPDSGAGPAMAKEARKLSSILHGMVEGAATADDEDIYASDYPLPDGDTFIYRAASLLNRMAAALAQQGAQNG